MIRSGKCIGLVHAITAAIAVVTLFAGTAVTGLQDRTNHVHSHNHINSSISE